MRTREVFIHNWNLKAFVGIHAHEKGRRQKLRLNITLVQEDSAAPEHLKIADVVDYEKHHNAITALVLKEHFPLLETLAEKMAGLCLEDKHVLEARIEIEKIDLFKGVESCGVRLSRKR